MSFAEDNRIYIAPYKVPAMPIDGEDGALVLSGAICAVGLQAELVDTRTAAKGVTKPKNYRQLLAAPDKAQWFNGMEAKMDNYTKLNLFTLVDPDTLDEKVAIMNSLWAFALAFSTDKVAQPHIAIVMNSRILYTSGMSSSDPIFGAGGSWGDDGS